jgi:hypothetical protein
LAKFHRLKTKAAVQCGGRKLEGPEKLPPYIIPTPLFLFKKKIGKVLDNFFS